MATTAKKSSICARQMAQLDELMDYLTFSCIHPELFRGIVSFRFCDADENTCCIRTVDRTTDQVIISGSDPCPNDRKGITRVVMSIADFLFMYSGEASPAQIAGMCMSGRVQVGWSHYGALKSFADSFDFTPESWERYYAVRGNSPAADRIECNGECCSSVKPLGLVDREHIDKNWQVIYNAVIETVGEWEIVNEEKISTIHLRDADALVPSSNDGDPRHLFNFAQVQKKLKQKVSTLQEYVVKLIQTLDE